MATLTAILEQCQRQLSRSCLSIKTNLYRNICKMHCQFLPWNSPLDTCLVSPGLYIFQLYRVNLILGLLPKLLCLLYLAFSLPVRLFQAMRHKTASILSAKEMVEFLSMTKDLGNTVEAIHVKKLLQPATPPPWVYFYFIFLLCSL